MSHKQTKSPRYTKQKERSAFLVSVYNDWVANPTLNLVEICNKHTITEETIRAWLRRHNKKRPDGVDRSVPSERHGWIIEGYNRGLELGLTARQASVWASEKSGTHIQRGDIQHYAAKFDLPLLAETDNGAFLGRYSKYD
jgi:transposase-like protein